MLRLLLLGPTGQVGWELLRSLRPLGELSSLGRVHADFGNLTALRQQLRSHRPDVIVNAAAYTAVDKAECERAAAMRINADAVQVLAEEARRSRALLVHYSTDYVFDGSASSEYVEDDRPNPLNTYGRSKLAGEQAIQASGCRHVIFRTSWVYGVRGANFPKTILKAAAERESLNVVSDQLGTPTSAELLADVTALCVALHVRLPEKYPLGLFHVVPSGITSWHAYAQYVVETARSHGIPLKTLPEAVRPISSSEYPSAAQRPKRCKLSPHKLESVFGLEMPDWKIAVERFVQQLAAQSLRRMSGDGSATNA